MPNITRRRTRRLAAGVGDEYVVQWGDAQDLRSRVYPVNDSYLDLFEDDMRQEGMDETSIRKYVVNADMYLNEFLLERENLQMPDGVAEFFGFMSRVYTKNPAGSDPAGVKSMCASIQRFYKSMLAHDRIWPSEYETLCQTIQDNQTGWVAAGRRLDFGTQTQ